MSQKDCFAKFWADRFDRRRVDTIYCAVDVETDGLGGDLLCVSYATESLLDAGYPDRAARPSTRAGRARKATRGGARTRPASDRAALGALGYEDQDVFTVHDHSDPVASWLDVFFGLPSPHVWYAHNASYDLRYILPQLVARAKGAGASIQILSRTGADIAEVRIKSAPESGKRRTWIIRDSFALYPASLAKFAQQFSQVKKLSGAIDFEGGERFDPSNDHHLSYALTDSLALVSALRGFECALRMSFGVAPGTTISGTAQRAWESTLPDDTYIRTSKPGPLEDIFRAAYYGGAVFLTSVEPHAGARTYDINSSYPAAMLQQPMPSGKPYLVTRRDPDKLGIYHARVYVPESLPIAPVPSRNARGDLIWRRGVVDALLTSVDLDTATDCGCTIEEIYEGIEWPRAARGLFDSFIHKCMKIRRESKGTSYEAVAKLIQNSVYGKFASARTRWEISDTMEADSLTTEIPGIYARHAYTDSMCVRPDFAAFITARARANLFLSAYSAGAEHVIYGDTDSITVTADADTSAIDVDATRYGAWKLEKTWSTFRAVAPKTYSGQIETEQGLNWDGRAKGIPQPKDKARRAEMFKDLYFSQQIAVQYQSLRNIVPAMRSGKLGEPAAAVTRKSSSLQNSVHYELDGSAVRAKMNTDEQQHARASNLFSAVRPLADRTTDLAAIHSVPIAA